MGTENTPRNTTMEAAVVTTSDPSASGLINRKVFYFAAACTANSLCTLDLSTTTYGLGTAAKIAPSGTDDPPDVVGVTEVAVAAGTFGEVVTYGPVKCKAHTDLDAGDPVCGYTTTAGMVREFVEGTDGNRVGFCLEDDGAITAGYARIFVQLGG